MEMKLSEATQILERTPSALSPLLLALPEPWLFATEGPDTWSCYDVVGHLIHGEITDWLPRIKIILEHGESRPFDTFDRFAQFKEGKAQPIDVLLNRFKDLRQQSLAELRSMNLGRQDFCRTGTHPQLGIVTLQQLMAAWVVHDLSHISQISRVLAKQYDVEVGPWKAFLGVLNR